MPGVPAVELMAGDHPRHGGGEWRVPGLDPFAGTAQGAPHSDLRLREVGRAAAAAPPAADRDDLVARVRAEVLELQRMLEGDPASRQLSSRERSR